MCFVFQYINHISFYGVMVKFIFYSLLPINDHKYMISAADFVEYFDAGSKRAEKIA